MIETIIIEQTASDETTTSETEPEPQETSSQQPTSQPAAPSKPAPPTSSNNSTGTTSSGNNKNQVYHPISGLPFKQLADPETGISWDGVSPIIYTYEDGTTGTEKRDGATYEGAPGMITTYNIPRDLADREIGTICPMCQKEIQVLSKGKYCTQNYRKGYCGECSVSIQPYTCHTCATYENNRFCSYCGKTSGDGTNGTCARWVMGDVDCPTCGEHVKVHTCHTCNTNSSSSFCTYCGKKEGNGTNGTCLRPFGSDMECPNCGKYLKANICHTCDE